MSEEPLFTKKFVTLWFTTFFSFTSFYFLLPTLPFYIEELGGKESEIGLIIGIFTFSAIIVRLLIGREIDNRGRKAILLLGAIGFLISMFLYLFTNSVISLFILRVFHGIAWAAVTTATATLAADLIPKKRRAEGMGYYGLAPNIAIGIGPAVGLFLLKSSGFNYPFLFLSALGLAFIALLFALTIKEPVIPKRPHESLSFISKKAIFPSLIIFFATLSYGAIVSFLPLYAEKSGVSNHALYFTAFAITLIIARPIAGRLADRIGISRVIVPGMILIFMGVSLLSLDMSFQLLIAAAILFGVGFAGVHPALMALAVSGVSPQRRGAAMASFASAFELGIALGSIVFGVVAQFIGYQAMFLISSISPIFGLIFYIFGYKKMRR